VIFVFLIDRMELQITTPALLFSTISLLLLAFSNRFLGIASVVRSLHEQYQRAPMSEILDQIKSLKLRLRLIRDMQIIAVLSLLFSVVCMFLLFADEHVIAQYVFGFSLLLQVTALVLSVWEIALSTTALNILLKDIESDAKQ
jgi:hypothetical protein